MANGPFDPNETFIQSPLRLILFVTRELIVRGYEGLRFYSYVKEGIGALRVGMYFEKPETGPNGEQIAFPSFWLGSFNGFLNDDSDWPGLFENSVHRQESVAQTTAGFEQTYLTAYAPARHHGAAKYLEWIDGVLAVCADDGFPITEEPNRDGLGSDGNQAMIVFNGPSQEVLVPRPPQFGNTVFRKL